MRLEYLQRTPQFHSNVRANDSCSIPCFKPDLVSEVRASLPSDEVIDQLRADFSALSDGTRLKILIALAGCEELCVCDVAHVAGVSISAASHHLRKLRDLDILGYRNDGKMAYYSLHDERFAALLKSAASNRPARNASRRAVS